MFQIGHIISLTLHFSCWYVHLLTLGACAAKHARVTVYMSYTLFSTLFLGFWCAEGLHVSAFIEQVSIT